MSRLLGNGITHLRMAIARWFLWRPLIRKTHNPSAAQAALLQSILKRNADTVFGRKHDFLNISSYGEYSNAVGVNEYEALRDYIEKQEAEKRPYLYPGQPVMYAQTSGSSGKPKYIPILEHMLSRYRKSQSVVAYAIYRAIPGAYSGKVLAIVSPAVEGALETGTPFGSMSGLIYKSMPKVMRSKYVVPPEVFELEDYEQKYYLIAKHALAEKNVTIIATANPSTLMKIEKIMNERPEELLAEIRAYDAHRADELAKALAHKGAFVFSDIWPNLKAVVTWKGGSCGVLLPSVQKQLSETTTLVEMGYLSSEFRGGITVDPLRDREILTLHENFYEFVEKEDWQNARASFLLLDQLEVGKQYYIFVTTQGGLYRYNINDIVEVTGWYNKTPTIRFVQKGKGVTNLTGEKLHEAQLINAMGLLQQESGSEIGFFIMLGCPESLTYTLFIEHDAFETSSVETHLNTLNMEFHDKRKSGRLKPTQIVFVKDGTGKAYEQHCLKDGKREGQFKLAYLQYKQDCSFEFMAHVRKASDEAD